MPRSFSALMLVAALLAAPGAAAQQPHTAAGAVDLLVAGDWLTERLEDPGIVVLHVGRDEADYQAGHVPGARWLALTSILVERDGVPNLLPEADALREAFETTGVSDDSHVVVYGDLGGLAATRTFFTLEYLGHPRVSLLDGGLETWKSQGRPLSTEPATSQRGSLTPRTRADRVVTADWVRERLDDAGYLLLDARPPAQYSGDDAAGLRPGHIPGAANLFWRNTLVSDDDPRLRDLDTLRSMYAAAGASADRTVVAYCRTGIQASHAYFTARLLDLPVVLYDGSFIEWSARDDLPVAR